jgi:hypothetical protein
MDARRILDAPRTLPITCNRALVLDVLRFARQVPLFPVEKAFELGEVAELRERSRPRISWVLLFLKAHALVARKHPPLRQAWISCPWPHLIEFPTSVATVAIQRQFRGEDRLCWGRFEQPEARSLVDLDRQLRRYQHEPVERIFKQQVALSRLPTPLRRGILWWNLNGSPRKRARRLGTFSLATLAGQGCLNRGHPSFHTTSLTYGPLDASGQCLVTLLADHRVLDGSRAAAALGDLERALQSDISSELKALGLGAMRRAG